MRLDSPVGFVQLIGDSFDREVINVAKPEDLLPHRWELVNSFQENMSELLLLKPSTRAWMCPGNPVFIDGV